MSWGIIPRGSAWTWYVWYWKHYSQRWFLRPITNFVIYNLKLIIYDHIFNTLHLLHVKARSHYVILCALCCCNCTSTPSLMLILSLLQVHFNCFPDAHLVPIELILCIMEKIVLSPIWCDSSGRSWVSGKQLSADAATKLHWNSIVAQCLN